MVHRKVGEQLGCHVQKESTGEKRLATLKPISSSNQQDAKNRATELRKKMMKSSPQIKLSDLENFTPPPIKKNCVSQPGKPPPQPQIKPDASPNYMKSTSSFDARKIPVSFPNNKTSSVKDGKIYGGRFSEPKTLTRSSSLTLVRTLTKTPTFKPARASSKKCSPAGICADMDSQRATCSSTLKDYKFPSYLELNHGGTETEGTSVWKVCPYTYCSLNGHRHSPSPPLKSFLSSRRRSLKALSTPEIKLAHDMMEQVESARKNDRDGLPTSPLAGEAESDFFVEIYCDERPKSEMESGEEITAGRGFCCGSPVEEDVEFSEDDEFGDSKSSKIEWEEQQFLSTKIDKTDEDYNTKTVHESEHKKDDLEQLSNEEIVDFEEHSDNGDSETCNDQCPEMEEMEIGFSDNQYQKLAIGAAYECSETESQADESFVANGVSEAEKDSETKEKDEAPSFSQQNQDPQYEIDISQESVRMGEEEQINNFPSTEENGEFGSADILNDDLTEEIETSQWMEESLEERESEEEEKTSLEHENGELEEQLDSCRDLKGTIRSKSSMLEEEERNFNPKEPNFLPIGEDPETEKVDLRPQMVDDRKNSEEWMLDYALQRAVTKLAPARKKKVALLVEAFETVLPTTSKCEEAHLIHSPAAFAQPKPLQACF